jgi:DNA-binding response OmpR family regulator
MTRHEPRPRLILVAEDDRGILQLIVTRLTLAGYQTVQARDGWEALASLQRSRPDAILLDINMPQLDGFGVLRRLNAKPFRPPPIMMLSARNATADIKLALSLGAKDYLAKPFQDEMLLARVARLLRPRPQVAATPPPPVEQDDAILL